MGIAILIMDVFIDHDVLEEAFFQGLDIAEEVVDRLSFLSFAPATFNPISVTVPSTKFEIPFDIGIPFIACWRSRSAISAERFEFPRPVPTAMSKLVNTLRHML